MSASCTKSDDRNASAAGSRVPICSCGEHSWPSNSPHRWFLVRSLGRSLDGLPNARCLVAVCLCQCFYPRTRRVVWILHELQDYRFQDIFPKNVLPGPSKVRRLISLKRYIPNNFVYIIFVYFADDDIYAESQAKVPSARGSPDLGPQQGSGD